MVSDKPEDDFDWKSAMGEASIVPVQPQVGYVKPRMGWPEAVSNICVSFCIAAILIVLFMVLWGPW